MLNAIALFVHLGASLSGELFHEFDALGDLNRKSRHRVIRQKKQPLRIEDLGGLAVLRKYLGKIGAKAFNGRWPDHVIEKQFSNG